MSGNLAQASASLRLVAQDAVELKQIFKTVNAESCPRFYNFHMHTVCSDGRLQPEDLMEQAIRLNLQGLAITDHHGVNGYHRAKSWFEDWQWRNPQSSRLRKKPSSSATRAGLRLWTGVEINANLLDTEVHILGYAFDPGHTRIQPYLQGHAVSRHSPLYQARQVITAIQRAGGLAVLAHPARYRRSPELLIPEAARLGIDGVETYYAYENPVPWQPSPKKTEQVKQLADRYALLSTCGTDTHGLNLCQRL